MVWDRAAGLVEEAEDSLRQARVNRLIEERVADAEAKVRDTLSRQYMQGTITIQISLH